MARSGAICYCIVLALAACAVQEARGAQLRDLLQVTRGATAANSQSAAPGSASSGLYGYNAGYNSAYNYYDYTECFSMYQLLNNTAGLSFITDSLAAVGLAATFDDPFLSATLFAPTDDAMTAAAASLNLTNDELLNSPMLLPILLYHVVAAPVLAEQLMNGTVITTLLEQNLTATVDTTVVAESISGVVAQATVYLNATESNAQVIGPDNLACAGVIHVIDNVLLPQILNVNVTGNRVAIEIGNGAGMIQNFLIIYDQMTTEVIIAAAPSPASAMAAAPTVTQAPATYSLLAPTGSALGQKTTAGTTYYTNANLTS